MIHPKIILKVLGLLLFIEVVMLLICSGISLYYGGADFDVFIVTSGVALFAGTVLYALGYKSGRTITRRDGYIIVTFGWIVLSAVGMIPLYCGGYAPSITNSFFEVISGFTTTGATVLTNIDKLPHGILFWRSLTHWVGGLGIIFFSIAIFSFFGVSDVQLFSAESTGPLHEKLHPRIGVAVKKIILVYLTITFSETAMLMIGHMSIFDALCHSMSTVATGGFSTRQSGIEYYHSDYIEYILIFFMFISGTNFSVLYIASKGKIRNLFRDDEFKWYFKSVLFMGFLATFFLYKSHYGSLELSFRKAFFLITSCHTTTGFTSADYSKWPTVIWLIMLIVMLVGGSAGSTAAGLKCSRMSIIAKIFKNDFLRIIHPVAILPVRFNKKVLPDSTKMSVLSYALLYLITAFFGTLIMMGMNVGIWESISTVVSSMGGVGPAIGNCGPLGTWNYLPDAGKWLCSFLMLAGRLELFPIFLMFFPKFWEKQ
jgi:trk system potassium uptake protein